MLIKVCGGGGGVRFSLPSNYHLFQHPEWPPSPYPLQPEAGLESTLTARPLSPVKTKEMREKEKVEKRLTDVSGVPMRVSCSNSITSGCVYCSVLLVLEPDAPHGTSDVYYKSFLLA